MSSGWSSSSLLAQFDVGAHRAALARRHLETLSVKTPEASPPVRPRPVLPGPQVVGPEVCRETLHHRTAAVVPRFKLPANHFAPSRHSDSNTVVSTVDEDRLVGDNGAPAPVHIFGLFLLGSSHRRNSQRSAWLDVPQRVPFIPQADSLGVRFDRRVVCGQNPKALPP